MQVKSKADPWISKELKVRERTLLEKCEEKLIHAKVYIFMLSSCSHKAAFQSDSKSVPNIKQLRPVLNVSTF